MSMLKVYRAIFSTLAAGAFIGIILDLLVFVLRLATDHAGAPDPGEFFATWWSVMRGCFTVLAVSATIEFLAEIVHLLERKRD